MNARRAIALLVAASALACGCSGDDEPLSKTEYAEVVRMAYGGVQEAFRRTNVGSPEDLAGRVGDAQDELREAADALEDLDPPEDVVAENAQIAQAMRAYADDLDALREAAERGDSAAIENFNSRVATNDAIVQMMEAAERVKFKGYDLGQIADE